MRRTLIALLTTALVVLTPTAALAAKSSAKTDPRGDVIGGPGIDMKKAKLVKQGKKVAVTFTTWNAFADTDLAAPGGIGIDFRRTKKLVRGAAVRHGAEGVYGEICSYRERRGGQLPKISQCSKVPVKRISDTAYRMTIPVAKIDKGARAVAWKASAYTVSGGCGGCLDGVGGPEFTTWRF